MSSYTRTTYIFEILLDGRYRINMNGVHRQHGHAPELLIAVLRDGGQLVDVAESHERSRKESMGKNGAQGKKAVQSCHGTELIWSSMASSNSEYFPAFLAPPNSASADLQSRELCFPRHLSHLPSSLDRSGKVKLLERFLIFQSSQNASRSLGRSRWQAQQWEIVNSEQSHRCYFESWLVEPQRRREQQTLSQNPLADSHRQFPVRSLRGILLWNWDTDHCAASPRLIHSEP